MKFIKLIVVLVFLAISFLSIKYLLPTLGWKTYQKNNASFQFKYPSKWNLCDEKEWQGAVVNVSVREGNCVSAVVGPYVSITDSDINTTESDLKTYLEKEAADFSKQEEANIKKGMLPTAPGFTWNFKNYEEGLISQEKVSVAIVGENEFRTHLALYDGHIYQLDFYPESDVQESPTKFILRSLKFLNK